MSGLSLPSAAKMAADGIRDFAGKALDRADAEKLLPWWDGYHQLKMADRIAALELFPERSFCSWVARCSNPKVPGDPLGLCPVHKRQVAGRPVMVP